MDTTLSALAVIRMHDRRNRLELEFFAWIAGEPEVGAVIKDSGGCRKVRWSRPGTGKSSGVRVIYFSRLAAGEL